MQESPPSTDNYLTLADVVGVYGVKGWVKLRPRLEDTDLLTSLPELHLHPPATSASASMLAQSEPVQVEAVRQQGKSLIAKLASIDDRTAAEALRGREIRVPAECFPLPGEGEFYWRDLVGLAVWCREDDTRVLLGVVDRLLETGANDVLVVTPDRGKC
jgi:16S rRNA processing protein RimM